MTLVSSPLSYDAALAFLDGLDVSAMKLGLSRIRAVLATLGNPQDRLPMIHIAGTNGKGSTAAMLTAIFKSGGMLPGTFTSPHLVDVRERIAVNGEPISPEDFAVEVAFLKGHLDALNWPRDDWPTYFEFLNIMAYRIFEQKRVGMSVFEVGLGGRLDSTNVVNFPTITVITGISLDHQERLGQSLAEIAGEKAGILKPGVPLVLGPAIPAEAWRVILRRAEALNVPVIEAEPERFQVESADIEGGQRLRDTRTGERHELNLLGPYQLRNMATVFGVLAALEAAGRKIPAGAVRQGLARVHWPSRFQYVADQNLLIDGGHNPEGFEALALGLTRYFPQRPKIWLVSLRANRNIDDLLDVIEASASTRGLVFSSGPKAHLYHPPEALLARWRARNPDAGIVGRVCGDPVAALGALRSLQDDHPGSLGVVCGSLYTAGAVLQQVGTPASAD